MRNFIKICKKEQMSLKKWLEKLLKAKYKEVINGDGYLYAKGSEKCPVLLTAHMDTVHKETCKYVDIKKEKGKTILSSKQGIGGDDRCGVWIIYMILTKTKYRPSILFCEDEEIGGVGSEKFVKTTYSEDLRKLKYLIELDRANPNDAVYYDCGNEEFMEYIKETIGYEKAYGSFSDISNLSPDCDVASVNLSCGYYKAHTLDEYVVFEEMLATYKATKKLLSKAKECESYDYQEERFTSLYDYYGKKYGYDNYGYTYGNWITQSKDVDCEYEITYEIQFNDNNGKESYDIIEASNYDEALGIFFRSHSDRCYNDIIDYWTDREVI